MLMRWTLLLFSCKIVSDSLWPPWTAACQASLSFIFSQSLLKLMSIVSVTLSKHLILLPSVFPSIRVFSIELALRIRWPKDWTISLSISPSNEYSGLISFRIDWFDLLAVQGTHKMYLDQLKYSLFGRYWIQSKGGTCGLMNTGGGRSWLKDSAFSEKEEAKLSGELRWADEEWKV